MDRRIAKSSFDILKGSVAQGQKFCNYSGTPIFEYNTDFIGLILKTKKFEYLILKFNKPMISMNYVYKNSGITKSSKKITCNIN